MELWGYIVLIAGALVIGLLAEYATRRTFGYEWLITAFGAAVGGFIASEYVESFGSYGTTWEGLRMFPALIGALFAGMLVEIVIHFVLHLPTSSDHTPQTR